MNFVFILVDQHLSGNKNRNAQVREDFPCALTEQLREERQAEYQAALYQQMVREQYVLKFVLFFCFNF